MDMAWLRMAPGAKACREMRNHLKLSQKELADEMGVSAGSVSKWESAYRDEYAGVDRLHEYALKCKLYVFAAAFRQILDEKNGGPHYHRWKWSGPELPGGCR